ncbi:MAG TPA: ROK family transcriptional regulator [Chloroflexia bacterium]
MPGLQKATQQQTKTHNSRLVLEAIYDRRQISRADISRLTNLTRTTVSDLVTELQGKGLVEEIGYGQSRGGRSPILLSVIDDARHLIGIDLENDELRGAVVNLRNEIISTASLPLHSREGDEALMLVYELVDRLIASTDKPLLGIGVGTPGLVDASNKVVLRAVNLNWRGTPLGDLLQARYDLPVYVANDSQLAALAQYMFGADKYDSNLIVVKVGTGIGAGLILDGRLFHGDGFGAGEIGHISVVENGQQCRCGNLGCLETVASTPAIIKSVHALAQPLSNSPAPDAGDLTLDAVQESFAAGHPAATQAVLEAGRYLGIAAANLVGTLNVHRIVFLSQLARFGTPLLDAIRQEMVRRVLPTLTQDTEIELIDLRPEMVILGASALLMSHELGLKLAR